MRGAAGFVCVLATVASAIVIELAVAPRAGEAGPMMVAGASLLIAILPAFAVAPAHTPAAPTLSFWLTATMSCALLLANLMALSFGYFESGIVDKSIYQLAYLHAVVIPGAIIGGAVAAVLSLLKRRRENTQQ